MLETIAKIVANTLYPKVSGSHPNNSDRLWEVIPDDDKKLCRKIAEAVLGEIRTPTPEMLDAADRVVNSLVERLASGSANEQDAKDVMSVAFTSMIDAARRCSNDNESSTS